MNQKKAKSIRRVCGFSRVPSAMSTTDRGNYRRVKKHYSSLPCGKPRVQFLDNVTIIEEQLRQLAESRKAASSESSS